MATKAEELLEHAYDVVAQDVVDQIRQHPQYAQFVQSMAAKGLEALFASVA